MAAVGADDAGRLIGLGAAANTTHVTGDPGIDSAAQRVRAVEQAAPHLRPFAAPRRPTIVAGSTWPSDETVLVPALVAVRRHHPSLRAVIAPHEPSEEAVRALEARAQREGWRSARLGQVESVGACGDADLVVVDRVGVLAELYTVGDVAWVGGGIPRSRPALGARAGRSWPAGAVRAPPPQSSSGWRAVGVGGGRVSCGMWTRRLRRSKAGSKTPMPGLHPALPAAAILKLISARPVGPPTCSPG